MLWAMFQIAAYPAPQLLNIDAIHFHTGTSPAEGVQSFAFRMRNLVGICWQLCNPLEKPEESSMLLLYFYIWMYIVFGEYSKDARIREVIFSYHTKRRLYQSLSSSTCTRVLSLLPP